MVEVGSLGLVGSKGGEGGGLKGGWVGGLGSCWVGVLRVGFYCFILNCGDIGKNPSH